MKSIGAGASVYVGGSVLAGALIGYLSMNDGADTLAISSHPAALIASSVAGALLALLAGYTTYSASPVHKWQNTWILGLLVLVLSYIVATIDFHAVDPGTLSDYVTAATVPFVLPLVLLGGYASKWQSERKRAPQLHYP